MVVLTMFYIRWSKNNELFGSCSLAIKDYSAETGLISITGYVIIVVWKKYAKYPPTAGRFNAPSQVFHLMAPNLVQ